MSMILMLAPTGASAYNIPDLGKIKGEKPGISTNTQSRTSGFLKTYTLTGDGAADMVAIALAQEGRTGSEFGYTEDWCANFVSDCAILAGQTAAVPQNGLVSSLYSKVISAGGTVTTQSPQPGDLCFINWNGGSSMGHVEIVYAVSGSTVYTIGGNSGGGTSLYTRYVRKHAPLSSSYIVSIVRPDYAVAASNEPSEMTVTGLTVPESILKGTTPALSGTVTCADTITRIRADILSNDTDATVSYAEATPASTTYNLADLLSRLNFVGLEAGTYVLQIEATGELHATGVIYQASFRVEAPCPHRYESVVTAPTCTEQGATTYTCTDCGESYTGSYTAALGHDYSLGTCTRCGTADPDYDGTIASGNSGGLTWVLNENGTLTFSGEGAMRNYEYKSEMPWYGYFDRITTVVLEEGVTAIGDYAFYGMAIDSIRIPETVTSIGNYAFKNCTALDGVVLPTGLTKLGESAFYACTGLTAIDIPASLWTVQPYTFKNCTALAEVTFHEGNLMKISDGAFYNTALRSVVLPDCLDILDMYVFKNCSALASVELSSGLTEIREASLYGTAISEITVPEGVTAIRPYAFKNCVNLTAVSLPSTLTAVEEAAFYACTGLASLALPDSVTTIGSYAFRRCTGLTDVSFGSGLVTIGESSFYGCTGLTDLVIPEAVTAIRGYAFKACTGLDTVALPGSLTTLGDSAFHTCTGLEEITIPGGVTGIGEYCFSGSTGINSIVFLGGAPVIGTGAFNRITATATYPGGNATWTEAVRQNYGGTITWTAR